MPQTHKPQEDAQLTSRRRPQAYEKQRGARREEQKELQRAAAQDQVRGFLEKEAAIVSRPLNPFTPKAASGDSPGEGEVDLKAGAILVGPRASLGAKSEPLPPSQMTPNPGPARAPQARTRTKRCPASGSRR